MNSNLSGVIDDEETKNLKDLLRTLVEEFPSSKISEKEPKSDNQLIQDLKQYVQRIVDMIVKSEIKPVSLDPNDNAPPRSAKELLNIIFYACLKLIGPPFNPTKFFIMKGFFADFYVEKLFSLLGTLPQRDPREYRFIENIIECTRLDTPDNYRKHAPVLQTIIRNQDEIRFIEDFPNYNEVTKEAFQFISVLFNYKNAHNLLQKAYGLLDLPEEAFEGNLDPQLPEVDEVMEHLQKLLALAKSVVQFPEVQDLLGRTLIGCQLAISVKCFQELADGLTHKQRVALLVVVLLHELSHIKKILYFSKGVFKKPTPEKFQHESGLFTEGILYGKTLRAQIPQIPENIANKILDVASWTTPAFVDAIENIDSNIVQKELSLFSQSHCLYYHDTWDPEYTNKNKESINKLLSDVLANIH